jgi:hypothetical protein
MSVCFSIAYLFQGMVPSVQNQQLETALLHHLDVFARLSNRYILLRRLLAGLI